jgi:replicative DNA helicase
MHPYSTPKTLDTEEAEQGLLGALLVRPKLIRDVTGNVAASDFYIPVHGRIYAKLAELLEKEMVATPVTLAPFFVGDSDLEHLGGAAYLAELSANVLTFHGMDGIAKFIASTAQRRKLRMLAQTAFEEAGDPDIEFIPMLADLTTELENLTKGKNEAVSQHEVIADILADLKRQDQVESTGIACIDKAMGGGLYRGFTYCFAAKAKAGKTTLAHSISYNLNQAGVKHAYIAFEMGQKQIVSRQIARHAEFNSLDFLTRKDDFFVQGVEAVGMGMPNNCVYLDMGHADFAELRQKLAHSVLKDGIKGFFLDYWQLVRGQEKGQTQEAHLASVAQWIAGFARKHNVWAVVIAQLNREDNAFGSAGINRACDQFYKLYRGEIEGCKDHSWLELEHSRYTFAGEVGNEMVPSLRHVTNYGPFMEDF